MPFPAGPCDAQFGGAALALDRRLRGDLLKKQASGRCGESVWLVSYRAVSAIRVTENTLVAFWLICKQQGAVNDSVMPPPVVHGCTHTFLLHDMLFGKGSHHRHSCCTQRSSARVFYFGIHATDALRQRRRDRRGRQVPLKGTLRGAWKRCSLAACFVVLLSPTDNKPCGESFVCLHVSHLWAPFAVRTLRLVGH